jgi:uncharacterized Ntn-hydrolase superfamily protein
MRATVFLALTWLSIPVAARATYSVVAVDRVTNEVGGVSASCVGNTDLRQIYGSVPGMGVVHAQALLGSPGRDRAVELLMDGVAPDLIVAMITDESFDLEAASRQYGIVDLEGRSAGFTGASTIDYADDVQGEHQSFVYSIQGNILTSGLVLDQSRDGFIEDACDLAARLMRALERGAENGEGDSRCTPRGIPSDHAFLQVDRAGEPPGTYLLLQVRDTEPEDPIALLRAEFDAWRLEHPCAVPSDAGVDAGAIDAAIARDAGAPDAATAIDDRDGCSCRVADTGGSIASSIAILVVARRRRTPPLPSRRARAIASRA